MKYGEDFSISKYDSYEQYLADPEKKEILKEGLNPEKEVKLWSVITAYEGECYRVSSLKTEVAKGHFQIITVNAKKSEVSMDDLSELKVYVTSNNNADGIYLSYYLDGDTLEFELKVSTESISASSIHFKYEHSSLRAASCKSQ